MWTCSNQYQLCYISIRPICAVSWVMFALQRQHLVMDELVQSVSLGQRKSHMRLGESPFASLIEIHAHGTLLNWFTSTVNSHSLLMFNSPVLLTACEPQDIITSSACWGIRERFYFKTASQLLWGLCNSQSIIIHIIMLITLNLFIYNSI